MIAANTAGTGGSADAGREAAQRWLLWQLADSAFPTGGFVHSAGLEAAWQLGEVGGARGLAPWLEDSLLQCGRSALPFVTSAHAALVPAASRPDDSATRALAAIDASCEAFTRNHVANRASRAQGNALLAAAAAAFATPGILALKAELRAGLRGHLAPAFGGVCATLGLGLDACQRLFLFLHLRGAMSAAVRLAIIGPLEAQALQHRLGPSAERVLDACRDLGAADAAQAVPLLDLFQGHHDRLYSRLFSS